MGRAASDVECALRQVPRLRDPFGIDHANNDRDAVLFEAFQSSELRDREEHSIDIQRVESLAFGPARDVGVKSFPRLDDRRENLEQALPRRRFDLSYDCGNALLFDRQVAVWTKLRSSLGE